jgi:hypothetical protein
MSTTAHQLITVRGFEAITIASSDEARATRDALLARAGKGTVVNSVTSAETAGNLLKDLKAFVRMVEDTRKLVKQPVLDQGRQIDALATELTARVDAEAGRLSRLLGGWQAEQNRIAEDARRKAWEEEERLRREAAAKIAHAEEHSRNQASADKKIAAIEEKTEAAIIETRVAAATVAAPKQEGVSTRGKVCFEVTDIVALYEACPPLVNLTPNTAAITSALKQLPAGKSLPGVRHWRENVAVVR